MVQAGGTVEEEGSSDETKMAPKNIQFLKEGDQKSRHFSAFESDFFSIPKRNKTVDIARFSRSTAKKDRKYLDYMIIYGNLVRYAVVTNSRIAIPHASGECSVILVDSDNTLVLNVNPLRNSQNATKTPVF